VFSENAAILVLRIKMLTNSGREIVLPPMRTNANNTIYAVPALPLLEEHVDAVRGTFARSSR
jgi:hypothetical protein